MIYFTADTHFNHSNIINTCGRPFKNVEQMNKTLIQNWNSCITAGDAVYILGDLVFKGTGSEVNKIIEKLNGKKYLIKGNHDKFIDDTSFNVNNFEWIKDYYVLNYEKIKFILFHYPIFEWDGYFGDAIHLYGHVHNSGNNKEQSKRFETLGKRAINVGVDVNSYCPISIQTIIKMVK
ncbi:metallophosphoesterase [Breznakiellaceae bacterium SP9]